MALDSLKKRKLTDLPSGRAFATSCDYSIHETVTIGGINQEQDPRTPTLLFHYMKELWMEGPFLEEERISASSIRCS